MKKKKVALLLLIGILIGVFSIAVSVNHFFFTTKYYKTPLEAYNADCTYSAIDGITEASKEIGVFTLDKENALFLGELTTDRFLVAEMALKDGKYALKGTTFFYDFSDESKDLNYNQTQIITGHIKWLIVYNQTDVETLSHVLSVKEYYHSGGSVIYLVLLNE